MANNGPNTNGSQFNLVFKDAEMEPTYTVFGTIDAAGLTTIDKIAKGGIAGNWEQGLSRQHGHGQLGAAGLRTPRAALGRGRHPVDVVNAFDVAHHVE
jgi:cyclophilin family peptidyl-prolyl cis-trans isomerase